MVLLWGFAHLVCYSSFKFTTHSISFFLLVLPVRTETVGRLGVRLFLSRELWFIPPLPPAYIKYLQHNCDPPPCLSAFVFLSCSPQSPVPAAQGLLVSVTEFTTCFHALVMCFTNFTASVAVESWGNSLLFLSLGQFCFPFDSVWTTAVCLLLLLPSKQSSPPLWAEVTLQMLSLSHSWLFLGNFFASVCSDLVTATLLPFVHPLLSRMLWKYWEGYLGQQKLGTWANLDDMVPLWADHRITERILRLSRSNPPVMGHPDRKKYAISGLYSHYLLCLPSCYIKLILISAF